MASDPAYHSPWPTRAAVTAATATLLASLGGLYFSAQSTLQATEQTRQTQASQASERFSRSVEQLGSGTITVRLGAVYSFGRLIRDSKADQQAISEILSSFVRLQAVAQPVAVPKDRYYRTAPADLLAALRVLDDQPKQPNQIGWRSMLLRGVDLSRFNLTTVEMRDANLNRANLTNADLTYSQLTGAELTGAKLTRADLAFADLTRAALVGANLTHAHLANANLNKSNLFGADLPRADLSGANLTGANLTRADLTRANLTGADLTGAHLTRANLTDVTCSKLTRWPKGLRAPLCPLVATSEVSLRKGAPVDTAPAHSDPATHR
jgi:uncharacterized protein YjbI with pentapeptide repeats